MNIEVVTVKFGRTINTGNCNSERYDAEVTALLENGEDVDKAFVVLAAMVRKWMSDQILYREEMRKVDRYLAGRPGEESLRQAMKRVEENQILDERDKEIFIEEMTGRLDSVKAPSLAKQVLINYQEMKQATANLRNKVQPQPRGNNYAT